MELTRFQASDLPSQAVISEVIHSEGTLLVENVLTPDFISAYKKDLSFAIEDHHKKWGHHSPKEYGMVLMCSLYDGAMIELLNDEILWKPFNSVLGESSIIYAYTSSSMPPQNTNYSSRIHVDCPRLIPNYVTNMGATILLDDFTEENGATWYLPKSYLVLEQPDSESFFKNAKRVVAKAGSVFYFNARIWHAGGFNQSSSWRMATTINMCRSYMKQRINIPKAMSHTDVSRYGEVAKQKLGFFCEPPISIEEFYLPIEKRPFRQSAE